MADAQVRSLARLLVNYSLGEHLRYKGKNIIDGFIQEVCIRPYVWLGPIAFPVTFNMINYNELQPRFVRAVKLWTLCRIYIGALRLRAKRTLKRRNAHLWILAVYDKRRLPYLQRPNGFVDYTS